MPTTTTMQIATKMSGCSALVVHTPHRMTPVTVMGQDPESTNGMSKSTV